MVQLTYAEMEEREERPRHTAVLLAQHITFANQPLVYDVYGGLVPYFERELSDGGGDYEST